MGTPLDQLLSMEIFSSRFHAVDAGVAAIHLRKPGIMGPLGNKRAHSKNRMARAQDDTFACFLAEIGDHFKKTKLIC